uniref:iron-containing alcohol dehydrogenase n=1 Tax=Ningiella ruwaisensis TaxID=2364274 RepID=UPI00109F03C5|nr:iron-containing alcohol dehydrogenase [Ningiella ruwaisensis]
MSNISFEFATTKRIVCKVNAISAITTYCADLAISRPLIVTDHGIRTAGLLDKLLDAFARSTDVDVGIFDGVEADPTDTQVQQALDVARSHQCDGVVGFGGGSSMDCAKLVAALCNSTQALPDIYGIGNIHHSRLPLILIPTTAGTGSEVTPISIVTTGANTKSGVVSPVLLPDIAILDAELCIGLPPHVSAATGIDAMVHAIEAYTSKIKKNIYSDTLAKRALQLLSQNIEAACFEGTNLKARENMLLGACMAGQAFANAPVGGVHALAYPLGGRFHIPHGLSNALVLPHVMRFNLSHASQAYSELASCVSFSNSEDKNDAALKFIQYFESLMSKLNLPNTLCDVGVTKSALNMLATDAMLQTRLLVNNPKPMTKNDALAIYQAAF